MELRVLPQQSIYYQLYHPCMSRQLLRPHVDDTYHGMTNLPLVSLTGQRRTMYPGSNKLELLPTFSWSATLLLS